MIITRAAIMFSNGEIIEGHNYVGITVMAKKLSLPGDKIYGFITSGGEFVLPNEAATIAHEAGQTPSLIEQLKPEDLWPEWVEE